MRVLSGFVIGIGALVVAGCSGSSHTTRPYHLRGTALPIEVRVQSEAGEKVSGIVHYRSSHSDVYQPALMRLNDQALRVELQTQHLRANDTLEYYIDVTTAGKLKTIGSQHAPFVVTFLDRDAMIMTNVRDHVFATDSEHEVRIVLTVGRHPIDQPIVFYKISGAAGDVRAPMVDDGLGGYQLTIPPAAVSPGTWTYTIEVPLNGKTYRIPEEGHRSFVVKETERKVIVRQPAH